MVPASDLLDLGIGADGDLQAWPGRTYRATRYRDRLPRRAADLLPNAAQEPDAPGDRRAPGAQRPRLPGELSGGETRSGRPYVAAVPDELTPYIDRWLQVYRRVPLMAAGQRRATARMRRHLWVGRAGRPMSSRAIRVADQVAHQAGLQQGGCVAAPVPGLRCDPSWSTVPPEEIGIAPDLLGHADLQTTRKHYIQAQGMTAHRRVQDLIAARRRAAARGERRVPEVAPTRGANLPAGLARHSLDLPIRLHETLPRFNRDGGDGRLDLAGGTCAWKITRRRSAPTTLTPRFCGG